MMTKTNMIMRMNMMTTKKFELTDPRLQKERFLSLQRHLRCFVVIIIIINTFIIIIINIIITINVVIITHPLPQATYTGVRTTVLGNQLFPSFLGKTKRE